MHIDDRIKISNLLSVYGVLLTEKQRRILTEYCELDLSLFEISEQYGITRQAVRDTVVKATAQLMDYEDKLKVIAHKNMLINKISVIDFCDNCAKSVEALKELLEE